MGRSGAAPLFLWSDMAARRRKKTSSKRARSVRQRSAPKRRRLTLKRAAKALAKVLFVHLVKVPEEDREERIAYVERALAKRLEKLKGKRK